MKLESLAMVIKSNSATLLPAMGGALVSLKYLPEGTTKFNMAFSWICSVIIAHFIGTGVADWIGLDDSVKTAVVVTTGIFGLNITSHLYAATGKIINAQLKKWKVI